MDITIRDIIDLAEMREVEQLQKEVWGVEDREVFPALALRPMTAIGAVLIGAFLKHQLIGFVFGFPGIEKGELILHSDMLAVKAEYRSQGIGYRLKLAQRDRALDKGIETISWTFDPLQSVNAYLNFTRLGVISDRYLVNFYGETTSFLHRTGTDRLWLTWQLKSARVVQRLAHTGKGSNPSAEIEGLPAFLHVGEGAEPLISDEPLNDEEIIIEIPWNIYPLSTDNFEMVVRWREATRQAFTKALEAGYSVMEFCRTERNGEIRGIYLLAAKNQAEARALARAPGSNHMTD